MDTVVNPLTQFAELWRQQVPTGAVSPALPAAVALLAFGVLTAVLGARLARWLITVAFVVGGLAAGLGLAQAAGLPPAPSALGGGLVFGAVGFVLYRVWVGVFAAVFLSSVVLSAYSSQVVVPRLLEFQQAIVAGSNPVQVLPAATDEAQSMPMPARPADWAPAKDYLDRFGQYLRGSEPNARRNSVLWAVAGGVVGLAMGLFLCRTTLILFTAAFGSLMIASGLAMLASHIGLDVPQVCQESPRITTGAIAALFALSLALQTMLTRRAVVAAAPAAP